MIRMAVVMRYSRALADVAFEKGEQETIAGDLATYSEIFRVVPGLLESFDSPAIPKEAKQRLLARLLERYPARQTTANFLRILLDHNRLLYFQIIRDQYLKTVNERNGIIAARVTSAIALSEAEASRLRQSLSEITGKQVALSLQTDAGLVGGLVIQVGSTVFDGSIRTQLAEMKQRLMA